jgi:hypothetical protein
VYAWNGTSKKYIQRGTDIDGEAEYDYSGSSVSLSANGKVLAIGARYNDGKNGNDSGNVRVYAWNSTFKKYIQRGTDIDGEAACDRSGTSVSLSADGKVVAIGAFSFSHDSGHVRVYVWNSNSKKHIQHGTDIDGEGADDQSGSAVSLSADGKVLAVSAMFNDGKNGKKSGHVRVYVWNSTFKTYTQLGIDIDGEAEYDYSGSAVSLSADCKVLAIGAWLNDGKKGNDAGNVRVYAWNSTIKKYIQRGTDIDGEAAGDRSGTSVSLSPDGKVLAIGTPYNHGKNGTYSGHVRVYAWGN